MRFSVPDFVPDLISVLVPDSVPVPVPDFMARTYACIHLPTMRLYTATFSGTGTERKTGKAKGERGKGRKPAREGPAYKEKLSYHLLVEGELEVS
jgi:hypothetical protein